MFEKCPICGEPKKENGDFCKVHQKAYANVIEMRDRWTKAFGGRLTEKGFLEKILSLDETGQAAKQVAEHMLSR